MNKTVQIIIKSFLCVALLIVVLISGYMLGYIIRGSDAIFMINNIMDHEYVTNNDEHIVLLCTRDALQDSIRNFYLLPEEVYLETFKNCSDYNENEDILTDPDDDSYNDPNDSYDDSNDSYNDPNDSYDDPNTHYRDQ